MVKRKSIDAVTLCNMFVKGKRSAFDCICGDTPCIVKKLSVENEKLHEMELNEFA